MFCLSSCQWKLTENTWALACLVMPQHTILVVSQAKQQNTTSFHWSYASCSVFPKCQGRHGLHLFDILVVCTTWNECVVFPIDLSDRMLIQVASYMSISLKIKQISRKYICCCFQGEYDTMNIRFGLGLDGKQNFHFSASFLSNLHIHTNMAWCCSILRWWGHMYTRVHICVHKISLGSAIIGLHGP